jgi:hypothetical protein
VIAHPILVRRWIQVALVYFGLAVTLGVAMAATHDYRLRAVHVHMNLLGWVSCALTGGIYLLFPTAAQTLAARVHFWLYNVTLPVMMASLGTLMLGHPSIEPVLAVSSVLMLAAVATFVVTVLRHSARSGPVAAARVEVVTRGRPA